MPERTRIVFRLPDQQFGRNPAGIGFDEQMVQPLTPGPWRDRLPVPGLGQRIFQETLSRHIFPKTAAEISGGDDRFGQGDIRPEKRCSRHRRGCRRDCTGFVGCSETKHRSANKQSAAKPLIHWDNPQGFSWCWSPIWIPSWLFSSIPFQQIAWKGHPDRDGRRPD